MFDTKISKSMTCKEIEETATRKIAAAFLGVSADGKITDTGARTRFASFDSRKGEAIVLSGAQRLKLVPVWSAVCGARVGVFASKGKGAFSCSPVLDIVSETDGDAEAQFSNIASRIVSVIDERFSLKRTAVFTHYAEPSELGKQYKHDKATKYNGVANWHADVVLRDAAFDSLFFSGGKDGGSVGYAQMRERGIDALDVNESVRCGCGVVKRVAPSTMLEEKPFRGYEKEIAGMLGYAVFDTVKAFSCKRDEEDRTRTVVVIEGACEARRRSIAEDMQALIEASACAGGYEIVAIDVDSHDTIELEHPMFGDFRIYRFSDHDLEFDAVCIANGRSALIGFSDTNPDDADFLYGNGEDEVKKEFARRVGLLGDALSALATEAPLTQIIDNPYGSNRYETFSSTDASHVNRLSCDRADDDWQRVSWYPNEKCWEEIRIASENDGGGETNAPASTAYRIRRTSDGGKTFEREYGARTIDFRCGNGR